MPAPFGTMIASVYQRNDGSYVVDVVFSTPHFVGAPDPVFSSPEHVEFPAGTKCIDRLDGLKAGDLEVHGWLARQGRDWDTWDLKEYLVYRMQ